VLLIGLTPGGSALIMLGLHLSILADRQRRTAGARHSVYHPADYAILSAHMDERAWAAPFRSITLPAFSAARCARDRGRTCCNDRSHGALIVTGAVGRSWRCCSSSSVFRRQRGGPSRQRRESATAKTS